jgi:hypothetical protein
MPRAAAAAALVALALSASFRAAAASGCPSDSNTRATPPCCGAKNYYNSAVVDVTLDCRNSGGDTKNFDQCKDSGCFLFAAANGIGRPQPPVANGVSLLATKADHPLAVPTAPCRGVEDAAKGVAGCKASSIWDEAWAAGVVAQNRDERAWGLAVNPTNLRGEHQLHVHVAQVQRSLQRALAEVATKQLTAPTEIDCTNRVTDACKLGSHAGPGKITARWVASNSFGDVFKTTSDTTCGTLLASKPTASGHVVVEMPGRPAECALYCPQAGDCDSKCTGNSFQCP